ncbi:hypothetical protein PIB30_094345 [Stylosanthes scabra]|uniref:Uncharacterized protein n=1 Tax=Stylosanthes scabra TaxID=79078 RepID=A0ABU6TWT2_9FABA|nr:hypothetical protein [Stylosanthes scabra]
MEEGTQSIEDELPVFNGIGGGYGWSISAWQFWNSKGTPEAQRLAEVEGEAGALQNATDITYQDPNPNTAEQQLISRLNSKKNVSKFQSITKPTVKRQDEENKAQLYELGSVDGDVADGFEPESAGEWSEPPLEPPDLDLLVEITDAGRLRSLDNECGQDVGSRGAE